MILKFDTGFQRILTLSASDSLTRRMIRAAQQETVRDYEISVRGLDGQWKRVASITGNYQRLNRVRFDPVEAQAVRVTVLKTNGLQEARIFEIRCYA